MPGILIAGCGYVGTATADLFHHAGWTVEGWTQSEESAVKVAGKAYPVIAVDIGKRNEVNARPENFDAVIHCASTRGGDVDLYRRVYLQGARNLLDRFVGSTFLFASSTSVYVQKEGEWVSEESAAEPEHDTGRVLRETEQLVLSGGGLVARLAGVYGPGRSALLRKLLSREAVLDPENDRFINQVHRDDIATALFRLLDRPLVRGQIYNVVDDRPVLQSECYRWLAERLNRPLPPAGKSISKRKRGQGNKRVRNAKLRAFGWTPRYPCFREGMEKSVLPSFGY
jgi:nucleoside-diphosphate-sugar epimerase